MINLSGTQVRDALKTELESRAKNFPGLVLAVVQVGQSAESEAYIRQKKNFGQSIGVDVRHIALPEDVSEKELLRCIEELNVETAVGGIIVQLPIPSRLSKRRVLDAIDPAKDADGLSSVQNGRRVTGQVAVLPATARGILTLLDYYEIDIAGKRAVVIGRSELVGLPTSLALLYRDATVTICHSRSQNLEEITRSADILVAACGVPRLVKASHVREGQVVIDVGIHKIEEDKREGQANSFCGDVDFESVKDIVAAATPVPGGVGPLTVASLFQNLLDLRESAIGL